MTTQMSTLSMFARFDTAIEAVLRGATPEEGYHYEFDNIVIEGNIVASLILLAELGSGLRYAIGAGVGIEVAAQRPFPRVDISAKDQDFASVAFQSSHSCIVEDYQKDVRTDAWYRAGFKSGISAFRLTFTIASSSTINGRPRVLGTIGPRGEEKKVLAPCELDNGFGRVGDCAESLDEQRELDTESRCNNIFIEPSPRFLQPRQVSALVRRH